MTLGTHLHWPRRLARVFLSSSNLWRERGGGEGEGSKGGQRVCQ